MQFLFKEDTNMSRFWWVAQRPICHRCQRYRWQVYRQCQQYWRQLAASVKDTGGKLPPVSMTLAVNFPPVSITMVANNWNNIRLLTPYSESELEGKNYLYVNSTTQRCTNKIIKTCLIEDFFCLLPVNCKYLHGFSKKFETALPCEKSLFVLASRQKMPVLRTESSAVDTRTICLPPIEFF